MLVSLSTKNHIIKELDRCDSCHFKLSDKQALKVHKESKHFGIKYDKKQLLKAHKDSKHNGIKYSCDECDNGANTKSILKVNIESKRKKNIIATNVITKQLTEVR